MPEYFVDLNIGPGEQKLIHQRGTPCEALRRGNFHDLLYQDNRFAAQILAQSWNHHANCCPKCCE